MKLYIANTTKQTNLFQYRLPENPRIYSCEIKAGQQTYVHGELNTPQIESIIEQHEQYGLVEAARVDQIKSYIGLCYSIDKPVEFNKIVKALTANEAVKEREGLEFRKNAAVALSANLNKQTDGSVNELSVEVIEEAKRGQTASKAPELIKVANANGRGRSKR